MRERKWIIKDGKIPDTILREIASSKGKMIIEFKRYNEQRTIPQNSSIHLYCEWVAQALNETGQTVTKFLRPGIEMMWTGAMVKELLWRPTQKILFGKQSTTQLNKLGEIEKIYDVINKAVSERSGRYIPFPSFEEYKE